MTLCAFVALGVPGCKIVKDTPEDEKAIPADASGDDARTELRIAETFEPKLVPYITENALPIATFRTRLSEGLDTVGAAHGTQGSGQGAAWNFPVTGEGVVVESKLDTRARTAGLDTDSDGSADVTIQLGPVIKGSALRDVAPFYNFDDFRDQIEFAKLSRAINDQISGLVELPEGDLIGQTMSFTGVVALKKADEAQIVTPIAIELKP